MTGTLPPVNFSAPFADERLARESFLLEGLNAMTEWHRERCPGYAAMLSAAFPDAMPASTLEGIPFLPTRIFKHVELKSVPDAQIVRQLTSSGTTGQQVSRIFLDAETSALQVRALASIVQSFVGKQRLPMLIVDQLEAVRGKASFSARAAGILGFWNFGHHHLYALDENMQPVWPDIRAFLDKCAGQPILLFGFTWVIWRNFVQAAEEQGVVLDFGPDSILVHGGGWKKLINQSVDNRVFKMRLADRFGIRRVCNYYGMVEQIGSIFMECEHGRLHVPGFADVILRDLASLQPAQSGAVEVMSLLPRSYPGHAILTEDIGSIVGEDDCPCGRMGKHIQIHGRIPKAEVRGCSDVRIS